MGPPAVVSRMVSNTLKLPIVRTISTKKIWGEIMGIMILKSVFVLPALSRAAASVMLLGMDWKAAIKIST